MLSETRVDANDVAAVRKIVYELDADNVLYNVPQEQRQIKEHLRLAICTMPGFPT